MQTKPSIYAFFDVDDTLINFNSMLDFLQYFFMEYFGMKEATKRLNKYKNESNILCDAPREVLNQLYYSNYKGVEKAVVRKAGITWFNETIKDNETAFNQNVLEKLKLHQQNNHVPVLVSGGFFAILEPLAKWVNIDNILCVELLSRGGYLTGKINLNAQTIGSGKATAIHSFIAKLADDIDLNHCYAYGDHISDYDMLSIVGNPVVVGNDMELLRKIEMLQRKVM